MGYSKKLYNVLGGVTSSIIASPIVFAYSQNTQTLQKVIAVFVNISQKSFVNYYQYTFINIRTKPQTHFDRSSLSPSEGLRRNAIHPHALE